MVCAKCGDETKGIKLNGKLFCTNCGEALLVPKATTPKRTPTTSETPVSDATPPKPKLITKEGDDPSEKQKEIEALRAEEEALLLIGKEAIQKTKADKAKKEAPNKDKTIKRGASKEIKKHNRDRITHKKNMQWAVLPNEPDPIKEPEIETPTEDQIEPPKENLADTNKYVGEVNLISPKKMPAEKPEKNEYPLLDKRKTEKIQEKRRGHHKVLNEFLKSTAGPTTQNQPKKKKREKSRHRKLFWILIILAIFILGFIALVLYVNFYAINPGRAQKQAESAVSFSYKKPSYIPSGYELSYKTSADVDYINYVYEYAPDKSKTIEIKISKSDLTKESFFPQKIQPLGQEYIQTTKDGVDLYFIGRNSLYFLNNGLSYEVVSAEKISQEELTKIAGGLI